MTAILLLFCWCGGIWILPAVGQSATYSNFQDLYQPQWSGAHIDVLSNGAQVQLVLDASSGTDLFPVSPGVPCHASYLATIAAR